jgi:hemerythrin superfamily protein
MAKSGKQSSAQSQPVAIELLETDHRKVEALFDEYEAEKEGDEETKRSIAERVCQELTAHAQLEEELFYPWLRDNLEEEDMELVEEALVEHAGAKDLIEQIEDATEIDASFDAKVKVLGEYIKHHVKEEEGEIFTKVADMKDELDTLGQEMHSRKAEIMEELGMEAQTEDEGAAALAGRGKSGRGQPAARGTR